MNARNAATARAQQAELDAIQDHAIAALPDCDSAGDIIEWNATTSTWSCGTEDDPTVEENFAKTTLPTCSASEFLKGNGTVLTCADATSAINGAEIDPTVEAFAKNPLPTCGAGQVLKANGTSLSCVTDTAGGFTETDPHVFAFAKSALPTCGAAQALKDNGVGGLSAPIFREAA